MNVAWREGWVSLGLSAVVVLLVAGYYVGEWQGIDFFVISIDHDDRLFGDFFRHYRTTGGSVLEVGRSTGGFFYSAFFALLMVPLALVGTEAAMAIWTIIQLASAAVLFALPLVRLIRIRAILIPVYALVFITSVPILNGFAWGQISIVLMACTVVAFDLHARGYRRVAGVVLGAAASIKFYPLLFALYFVLKRDWRAVGSTIATVIALFVVIPVLVLGPWTWWDFHVAAITGIVGVDWVSADGASQNWGHVFARWTGGREWFEFPITVIKIVGAVIVASNLVVARMAVRRGLRGHPAIAVVSMCLALPFLLETSWPHYFVFLPLCQLAVAELVWHGHGTRASKIAWSLPIVLSVLLAGVFAFSHFESWRTYYGSGAIFAAAALLLIPLQGVAWIQCKRAQQFVVAS